MHAVAVCEVMGLLSLRFGWLYWVGSNGAGLFGERSQCVM